MKTWWALVLLFSANSWATTPNFYQYSGEIAGANGLPSEDTVNLIFQIRSPDGACLLYEEKHNAVNLQLTQGKFSVNVGSDVVGESASKRTTNDPGLAMRTIFSNGNSAIRASGAANCTTGYTPVAGHARKLRVMVEGPSGTDTLSPDQTLGGAPTATVAETLQGLQPGNFILNTIADMQRKIEDLVNGVSAQYLKSDGSNLSPTIVRNALNSSPGAVSVTTPTATSDATNKGYVDGKLGGQALDVTGRADGHILVWNAAQNKFVTIDPNAIPGGADAGGAVETITSSSNIVLSDTSAKVQFVNFSGSGGSLKLPNATVLSQGGPLFTVMNGSPTQTIPVFDSAGNFLAGVNSGKTINFFLFNNSTAAGQWRTDGTFSSSSGASLAIEAIVSSLSTVTNATSSVADMRMLKLDATRYMLLYRKDYINPTVARQVIFNPTTGASQVGAEITIDSSANMLYTPTATLQKLSADRGLFVYTDNSAYGMKAQIIDFNTDGTLTLGSALTTTASSSYDIFAAATSTTSAIIAYRNQLTSQYNIGFVGLTVSGSTLTEVDTDFTANTGQYHYIQGFAQLSGNDAILSYVDSGGGVPKVMLVNFNGTVVSLGTPLTIPGSLYYSYKGFRVLDGTHAAVYYESSTNAIDEAVVVTNTAGVLSAGTPVAFGPLSNTEIVEIAGVAYFHHEDYSFSPSRRFFRTISWDGTTLSHGAPVQVWRPMSCYNGGELFQIGKAVCPESSGININLNVKVGVAN